MPTCLFIRGEPGSGKDTVSRILESDLGWTRLWVHHFDAVYKAIGEHRVPRLTNTLIDAVVVHLMSENRIWNLDRNIIVVRPARQSWAVQTISLEALEYGYRFIPVRLTASYETLLDRTCSREPTGFRIHDGASLDEYLNSRPLEEFPGEHVIATDALTPEEVADKIKGLL